MPYHTARRRATSRNYQFALFAAVQSVPVLAYGIPAGGATFSTRNISQAYTPEDYAIRTTHIADRTHLDAANPVAVVEVCALCVHHQPLAPLEEHRASACDLWEAAVLTQHCILCIFSLEKVPAGRQQKGQLAWQMG
jgi:hypothetical protein